MQLYSAIFPIDSLGFNESKNEYTKMRLFLENSTGQSCYTAIKYTENQAFSHFLPHKSPIIIPFAELTSKAPKISYLAVKFNLWQLFNHLKNRHYRHLMNYIPELIKDKFFPELFNHKISKRKLRYFTQFLQNFLLYQYVYISILSKISLNCFLSSKSSSKSLIGLG